MAKPHKFAWNGVDIETSLSFEQVANLAQRAAQESTGDLLHGKHRIASVKSSERQIEFRINDYLITFNKFLVFHLDLESRGGRTWASTRIEWYVTTQPTVAGFIPAGSKTMVGHHTYMQFVRNLADQVRGADPGARVTMREGAAGAAVEAAPRTTPPAAPPIPPATLQVPGTRNPPPPPPPPSVGGNRRPAAPPPTPAVGGRGGLRSPAVSAGLVTSVPGVRHDVQPVPSPPEPPSSRFAVARQTLGVEDDAVFHTQLVRPLAARWELELGASETVPLIGARVLGRDPVSPPGVDAQATPLHDLRRSISKTHALIELRDGTPWVTDLRSTNGTRVLTGRGESLICDPGTPREIQDGWTVQLGEFRVRVQQARA